MVVGILPLACILLVAGLVLVAYNEVRQFMVVRAMLAR